MSGSVFLNNLDDFIAPSQACVNPFVNGTNPPPTNEKSDPYQVTINNKPSKKHRITLEPEEFQFNSDFDKFDYSFNASIPAQYQTFSSAPPPPVEPNLIKSTTSSTDAKTTVATVSLNDCFSL